MIRINSIPGIYNEVTYNLQDIEDIQMIGIKKTGVGLESSKIVRISFMYNFRCDPDLGTGEVACRRISCVFLTYLELLNTTCDTDLDNK